MVNLNGVSRGFVPAYCGGGYKPYNQLVTRMPLGATKNCIMKKIVFFIAIAFFLALASPLCRGQRITVEGHVCDKESEAPLVGLQIAPIVQIVGTTMSVRADYGAHYSIVIPNTQMYRCLEASAGEKWEPQQLPVRNNLDFYLQRKRDNDEGNAQYLMWLHLALDLLQATGSAASIIALIKMLSPFV